MNSSLDSIISDQQSILVLFQQQGALLTDISDSLHFNDSSIADITDLILFYVRNIYSDTGYLVDYFESFINRFNMMYSSINTLSSSQMFYLDSIDTTLESMHGHNITLIGILQNVADNVSTFGGYFDAVLENQQAANASLANIESALFYSESGIGHTVTLLNNNVNGKLKSVIANQEALLALLQQDGAFTTDLSGVLADLGTVISNQSAAFSVLEETSGILSTISDELNFVRSRMLYDGATSAHYLYDIKKKLNSALDTLSSDHQSILTLLQQEGAFTTDISGILENQQKLIDLIEDLELTTNVTIENIENIKIDVTNKAYEVFYITDSEGNEQNLADLSGDVLTISGRLLNFFFKVAFDDAMDSVDSALDDMTEFYLEDSVVVGGSSLWE